jgi:hypothetical protein
MTMLEGQTRIPLVDVDRLPDDLRETFRIPSAGFWKR